MNESKKMTENEDVLPTITEYSTWIATLHKADGTPFKLKIPVFKNGIPEDQQIQTAVDNYFIENKIIQIELQETEKQYKKPWWKFW